MTAATGLSLRLLATPCPGVAFHLRHLHWSNLEFSHLKPDGCLQT